MSYQKRPIDPICALCRIALLNFKHTNTKIGVTEHSINIQDPGTLQCLLRYYNHDGKEDIYELFYLVTQIITWFLVPPKRSGTKKKALEPTPETSTDISSDAMSPETAFIGELKRMVYYMCNGLQRLQDTYRTGNVILTLQYYINLLDDGLNGKFNIKQIPHCLVDDMRVDLKLKQKVESLWDYARLHRLCTIYDDCCAELSKDSSFKNEIVNAYLVAIEQLLSSYEKEFNTRYT
jgi:hypothetical protein